jgi:hypothetical protein
MFEQPISETNFILVAMHHYDNPQCTTIEEFEEDLKRFGYLKKLFGRYVENNELRERLIVNHITVLFNLFGIVTVELLFFKIDEQYWNILATFLTFLNKMPERVPEFGIIASDLVLDDRIIEALRKI